MRQIMSECYNALYNYQPVKYSHFYNEPGSTVMLCADPWAYLQAYLTKQISIKKNKSDLQRALYFAKLAESFYKASNDIDLPAKSTLAYYGILNLVKTYLVLNGIKLEKDFETHGISLSQARTLKISRNTVAISIFEQFCNLMGKPIPTAEEITVAEILNHIPELHEMAHGINVLSSKRKYLPIKISFKVNEEKNRVFTEISFEKQHEQRVDTSKFYTDAIKSYFKEFQSTTEKICYRSIKKKNVNKSNWVRIYRNICKEYKNFNIVSILTTKGYRYYYDLKPGKYHHLSYSYLFLFYLGTVVRYRPIETEDLLNSELRPLVSDGIEIIPNQFLYQIVGLITKQMLVYPISKFR